MEWAALNKKAKVFYGIREGILLLKKNQKGQEMSTKTGQLFTYHWVYLVGHNIFQICLSGFSLCPNSMLKYNIAEKKNTVISKSHLNSITHIFLTNKNTYTPHNTRPGNYDNIPITIISLFTRTTMTTLTHPHQRIYIYTVLQQQMLGIYMCHCLHSWCVAPTHRQDGGGGGGRWNTPRESPACDT